MVRFRSRRATRPSVWARRTCPGQGGQGIIGYSVNGTAYGCTSAFIAYTGRGPTRDLHLHLPHAHRGHCVPVNETQNYFTEADLYVVGASPTA